jgi:geranylgeranyl diphosphate synthase type I
MSVPSSARLDPRPPTPAALGRSRELVQPALRAAVERLADARMRLIAGYQLGWCDADGSPTDGGGKAIRPALALLAAEAVCGDPAPAVPAAVAVELVHNFSLLHDDIMDRDVERRHRPTGWVVFGEGQAILAGNAMLTAAFEVLVCGETPTQGSLELLLAAVQHLIRGQSADLALERGDDVELAEVLDMEIGKTAALMECALGLGAIAAGAAPPVVGHLRAAGRHMGLAFQLVDDILGVVGDPAVTGKSASSDVRAGKRSVPVIAALRAGSAESASLARLLAAGPPETDADVARAVSLIEAAGGIRWTANEAERLLGQALAEFEAAQLPHPDAVAQLREVAAFLVHRTW